ncbi:hypothetical protein VTK26DRAFT_7221 [Humicola hyalothermophila]
MGQVLPAMEAQHIGGHFLVALGLGSAAQLLIGILGVVGNGRGLELGKAEDHAKQAAGGLPVDGAGEEDVGDLGDRHLALRHQALGALGHAAKYIAAIVEVQHEAGPRRVGRGGADDLDIAVHHLFLRPKQERGWFLWFSGGGEQDEDGKASRVGYVVGPRAPADAIGEEIVGDNGRPGAFYLDEGRRGPCSRSGRRVEAEIGGGRMALQRR